MNTTKIIALAVAVIAVIGIVAIIQKTPARVPEQRQAAKPAFSTIQQDIKNGGRFYDVRTAEEYTAGHFEGAVNWSLQDMQAGKLPEVAKDTKIYVHCRTGKRSGQAASILRKAGFTQVTDLGGLSDVQAMGGSLQSQAAR